MHHRDLSTAKPQSDDRDPWPWPINSVTVHRPHDWPVLDRKPTYGQHRRAPRPRPSEPVTVTDDTATTEDTVNTSHDDRNHDLDTDDDPTAAQANQPEPPDGHYRGRHRRPPRWRRNPPADPDPSPTDAQ
ncbi:hypothetical protein [Actinoplanes sp. NPDC051859]|uniref:hypothetical protein n=1 Tax=Actinoplanes sp. NPDC051859 TaxID=3363909 RepID=UPI0037BCE2F4